MQWALEDVKAVVQAANVEWAQAKVAVQIAPGKDLKEEGFRLAIAGDQVTVTGGDTSGAMYGLLELAEQIRNGGARGDWKKVVATLSATKQEPAVQFRASNPFIHTYPHLLLDDVEMWKGYIDMLARNRFNVLDLHGGYEYKSGFGFPNLYPMLVQVKEYPTVGKPDQQAKNLKNFRAIAAHAHARGLKVAFMNYEAGGNGAPTSQLADYTAKAVSTLLREMPELDMLGFRVGESGQPAEFFKDAYLKGFTDSGRKDVRLYSRSWLTTQAALEAIGRAANNGFDIEIKYNGEQLGLPYHAIQAGGASYSYEGYIRNDAPYQIIWQVRADGTHRFWAWENTDFIRRCVGTFALGQARGFSVEPSFSYYPVTAATYYANPEDQKVPGAGLASNPT